LDQSQLIFPKTLISTPIDSYSITFWIKGFSNGHLLSCGNGQNSYQSANQPMLIVKDGKINIYDGSKGAFNHPELDYNWHHIAICVKSEGYSSIAQLFIDGVMVDSIKLGSGRSTEAVKFLLGGTTIYNDTPGFDMLIDNLRIYGSRAISEEEVAQIYFEEQ
jgi:hypothetical protein